MFFVFDLQGARGFPGTPGLPGMKGHRVSADFFPSALTLPDPLWTPESSNKVLKRRKWKWRHTCAP